VAIATVLRPEGNKGYGRLDCPNALRWIAKGYYVKHRVFFADEATAIAAGYRPSACCLKERYTIGKQALAQARNRGRALGIYGQLLERQSHRRKQ